MIGNGSIIGPTNTTTSSVASGIWSLREAMLRQKAGTWPTVGGPATISYTTSATSLSALTTYTFSSQAIGTAASNRSIIVGIVGLQGNNTNRTVASVTVGGVSLSEVVASGAQPYVMTALWKGNVPSGTTGDVVVTFSNAMQDGCAIDVFAAYGAASAASDTGADAGVKSPLSDTGATVPANGFAVAVCGNNDDPGRTVTWAGVDETSDAVFGTYYGHTSAAKQYTAVQSGLTISATFSAVPDAGTMCWASFGPF